MRSVLLASTLLGAAVGMPLAIARAQAGVAPLPAADSAIVTASGSGSGGGLRVGAWVAAASNSPRLGVLGDTPGRDLFLAGLRASWPVWTGTTAALEYTVDVVPVALISDGPAPVGGGGRCMWSDCATSGTPFDGSERFDRIRAFGAGVAPLGIELTLRRASRVRIHAGASGGAMLFSRAVPLEPASHFNFTADAGAGVTIAARSGYGLTLGYRFHHISNGGLAPWNPAVASHMLVVGARRLR